jgi:hypothetical protein
MSTVHDDKKIRPLANALSLDCADEDYLNAGAG